MKQWIFIGLLVGLNGPIAAYDCRDAQADILNISDQQRQNLAIDNVDYYDVDSFVQSKPSLGNDNITTRTLTVDDGPYEQLWCKLKSQESVRAAFGLQVLGEVNGCRLAQQKIFQEQLLELGLADRSLQDLGLRLLDDQDFRTGSGWAPSQVLVENDGFGAVNVQAMRLKTIRWVPIFGGMNYCKLISPAGARELLLDRARSQPTPAISKRTISWPVSPLLGEQSAEMYMATSDWQQAMATAKGSYIISPGGGIPSAAMIGLASQIVQRGYIVFVVQHPSDLAILDIVSGRGNAAVRLARLLKTAALADADMDLSALATKPVSLFGHSLGGATLSREILQNPEQDYADRIVLYGTAELVNFARDSSVENRPLALFFGEADRLSEANIPGFIQDFGFDDPDSFALQRSQKFPDIVYQRLEGLNHFCIVSDQTAGSAVLKLADGNGKEPPVCIDRLLDSMQAADFL